MCMPSKCGSCGKQSWVGCGAHVPRVMDPFPKEEWCSCPKPEGSEYPPGMIRAPRTQAQREADERAARGE